MRRDRDRPRWLGLLVVVLLVTAAAACDPKPPNDGRDIGITALDAPTDLAPGEEVMVQARVTGHGSAPSTGAKVGYLVHPGLQVVEVTGPTVTGCTLEADEGTCSIGTLAVGASTDVEFRVRGLTAGTHALELLASSGGTEPSPDPHPPSVELALTVGTGAPVDLYVTGETPDQVHLAEDFHSTTWLTNRSERAASGVTVTQVVEGSFTRYGARLWRPSPGGDVEGDCTTTGGTVSCTTGGILVEPTRDPDDRWRLDVWLIAATAGDFRVTHTVASPHPEPVPDRWANEDVVDGYAGDGPGLLFDPIGPVEVGETFTVTAEWYSFYYYAQYFSVDASPSITVLGAGCPGDPTYFQCAPGGQRPHPPFTFTLLATEADDDAYIGATLSSELGHEGGFESFQIIDPSITSDIHPDLEAPERVVIGDPAEITGVVRNGGATPQQDVTLDFALPGSVAVDQATWSEAGLPCAVAATTVSCDLGTVEPHSSVSVALTLLPQSAVPVSLTATVTSGTPQDVPDSHPDQQTLTFPVDEAFVDLGVTVAVDPDPPVLDVALELTATVTNHGTVDATGVDLELEVPAGLTVTSAEVMGPWPPSSGTCTIVGSVVTCPLGTFAPSATHDVRVRATVPTTVNGTLEASVSADQPEPAPDPHPNEVSRPLTTSAPYADMEVRISPQSPQPSVVDEPFTIDVTALNRGPSDVTDAELRIDVPPDWAIQSVGPEFGVSCTTSTQVVMCDLPQMWGNGTHRQVRLIVVPGAPSSGSEFRASVTAELPDPGPRPNEGTAIIQVVPAEVDLDLFTTAPAEAPAGENRVTVVVRNLGPAIAHDAVLTATFPASVEVEAASFSHTNWTCDIEGQTVTCQAQTMWTGTYDLYLSLRHTAFGPIAYQVAISSDTPEVSPDVGPNTLVIDRTVVPSPGDISGSVRGPTGPVSSVIVRAYRVTDGIESTATTATYADGSFSFTDLPPGEYRIRFAPPPGSGLGIEWWQDKTSRATATPLVVDGLHEEHVLDAVLNAL